MMTSGQRNESGETSPLGMIVDRSSFDDDELTQTHSDGEGSAPIKRRNGKVRRKLRWKPPSFRAPRRRSSNDSVTTEKSGKSFGSFLSFHTFHSTATPVMGNKVSLQKKPIGRPNYRDTFEGVATIDNEGGYVHSQMKNARDGVLPRSQTLPTTDTVFETVPYEEAHDPYDPDPRLDPLKFSKKRKNDRKQEGRPPMAPPTKHLPRPGAMARQKEPVAASPLSVDTSVSTRSTSSDMSLDDSLSSLPPREVDADRHIGFFTEPTGVTSSAIVTPSKPQLTPTSSSRPLRGTQTKASPSTVVVKSSMLPDNMSRQAPKKYNRPLDSTTVQEIPTTLSSPRSNTEGSFTSLLSKESVPRPPSPRSRTGPVDMDNGCFLEVDRNLSAIHEMASEHLAHGEYAEALEVFEEILRGQRERFGPDHYRVGTALHNIGIVHLRARNYADAVDVCQEAVRVREEALAPNHPDVAVSLAQLGVAYLESHKYRDALTAFQAALEIRREHFGSRHAKVGKILNNVGCALFELGEMEGAELAFEEALEIQRETLRCSPLLDESGSTNQSLLSIATSLCNLGSIKLRQGEVTDAGVLFEEALIFQQSVLADDHPTVLSTIENVNRADTAMNSRFNAPLSKIVSKLSCGTSPHYLPSSMSFDAEERALKCGSDSVEHAGTFNFSNAIGLIKQVAQDKAYACGDHPSFEDETSAADSSVRDLDKDNRVEV